MYRVPLSLARALAAAASASFLLSGCVGMGASGPAALGGYGYRSIKDDQVNVAAAAPAAPKPVPKRASAKPAPTRTVIATPPPKAKPRPPAIEHSDVPTCATDSECMVQLKALIDDPSRSWIGKVPPPAEYAAGTRLFAYRALRTQLTCPQLTAALGEIADASTTFRSPVPGVTPVQAKRVLALNAEVGRELQAEFATRCKS